MDTSMAAKKRNAEVKLVLANIFIVSLSLHKIITSEHTSDILIKISYIPSS